MGVQISPWEGVILRGEGQPTVKYRDIAVICAKTAEPMVMTFGLWVLTGLRNHELDGGPDPPTGRGILGKKAPIVKYRDFLP